MSRADEIYVINRDMSVRSLRDGVRRRKPVVFPLPIVIDPDSTGPITDIQITDAGAPDPGSVEFSVADSGDGARGTGCCCAEPGRHIVTRHRLSGVQ